MKYPIFNNDITNQLFLTDLSGGLNKMVPENLINKNEQSDIKNMWFYNGALRNRPAINKKFEFYDYKKTDIILDGKQFFYKLENPAIGTNIYSFFVDKNGEITHNETLYIEPFSGDNDFTYSTAYHCFAFLHNEKIYLAVAYRDIIDDFTKGEIFKLENSIFTKVNEQEIYAPLIMINGKGNKYGSLDGFDNVVYTKSSSFEGINILTNRVRVQYTTDGVSNMFALTKPYNTDKPIKVKFYGSINSVVSDFEVTLQLNTPTILPNDIKCYVKGSFGSLVFEDQNGKEISPGASSIAGNLEIEFYLKENENMQSFFEMEECCFFGGSGGSGKGNRLFVYKNENHKNLLRWSDINNPFYFPENNYVNISNDRILALEKQDDKLLVFSEKSIHYAQYIGGEYSAEDILNGTVTDITAASAIFPITQLSYEMGILSPKALTVINGKTYFLSNTKKVCRINSNNSITILSQKIEPLLLNKILDSAVLIPYKNYLLVVLKNEIFCFNTDYSSWYYWECSNSFYDAFKLGDDTFLISQNGIYSFFGSEDFESYFKTAEFNFGVPNKNKKLTYIFCDTDKGSIQFYYNKAKGSLKKAIDKNLKFGSNIKSFKTLQLKISVESSIEGIILHYSINKN